MEDIKYILNKYAEIYMYLIIGVFTTLLSLVLYTILSKLGFSVSTSNIISNIIAIVFAFITNSIFVFRYKFTSIKLLLIKFFQFSFLRIVIMFLETIALIFIVDYLDFNKYISKFITTILIIIINYIISKYIIYKKD